MRAFEFLIEAPAAGNPNAAKIQSDITQKVRSIFDIDELNQIYSYVRKMDLGGGFDEIFSKDEDLKQVQTTLAQSIINVKAPFDRKMGFAKELVGEGIIDLEQLIKPGVTNQITGLVKTNYPEIYEGIAADLMNISGSFKSGTTKTNRGKGEFFLAILSPAIMLSKTGHGDLTINKEGYEVKDNLARIKGRKGYGTTDQAKEEILKEVNRFIDSAVEKNPNSPLKGKSFSVGVGAKQNFWTEFGPLAISGGAQPTAVLNFITAQWGKIIKSLFLNITNAQLQSISLFNNQGVMDFPSLLNPMKALAFNYYKTADGFKGVLFVNSAKMTITYIETAEEFVEKIGIAKYGFEGGAQNGMQVKTP